MRNSTRRALAGAFALPLAIAPLAIGAPALAAPDYATYDALGDSVAAGIGAPEGHAYPEYLDGRKRIALEDFPAFSGATTADIVNSQVDALSADTDLVTLTVGANDTNWTGAVAVCLVFDDEVCELFLAQIAGQISALPSSLAGAYTAVRTEAPNAHVVVTGYPHLFNSKFGDYTVHLTEADIQALTPFVVEYGGEFAGAIIQTIQQNPVLTMSVAEQEAANQVIDLMNSVIEGSATAAGFQYVDLVWLFNNHGINARAPWINGIVLDPVNFTQTFHPNQGGNRAIGSELAGEIKNSSIR